jgi:hypothetical protein
MTTDPKLAAAAQAVQSAGCHTRAEGTRGLVFYPHFEDHLGAYLGDVAVEVRATPLGLRYVVYEEIAGAILSPGGAHEIGDWLLTHLGRRIENAYWWSYRKVWGWLHSHRWIGLPQAYSVAYQATHQFHLDCLAVADEMERLELGPNA